jgi:hypothetical protein
MTEQISTSTKAFKLNNVFLYIEKIVIDRNESYWMHGDKGVPKDSTPGRIGSADSLMNEDSIGALLHRPLGLRAVKTRSGTCRSSEQSSSANLDHVRPQG